jgi:Tat protein translocase TatB subunit
MGIGNIGWTEFVFILAIALIFFGPRRLPGIAQAIGKSLREFQKALNEVKSEMAQATQDSDVKSEVRNILPRPAELMTSAPVPEDAQPETTKEAEAAAAPPPPPGVTAAANTEGEADGAPAKATEPSSSEEKETEDGDRRSPNVS